MAGALTPGSPHAAWTQWTPRHTASTCLGHVRRPLVMLAALAALLLVVLPVAVVHVGGGGLAIGKWDPTSVPVGASCTKRPLVLVYNRIPKAGSSTLMALFKELAAEHGYRYVTPEPYHDHAKLRRAIFRAIEDDEQTLIVNHFWYPEIQYGGVDDSSVIDYMNVVREPAARAVSDYYYLRYGSDRNPKARAAYLEEHGDLPMDACYDDGSSDGGSRNRGSSRFENSPEKQTPCRLPTNVQADYFCGREGHPCHEASNAPLKARLARANMDAFYTVGVNERFLDTVRMLEATYPSFFQGLTDMYEREQRREGGRNQNANKGNASAALVSRLERDNAIDVELWRRANARLDEYLRMCLV